MSLIPDLMQYVWLFLMLIIAVLQIAAAVILLKDRHMGAWLILAGSVALLLLALAPQILLFAVNSGIEISDARYYILLNVLNILGWLLLALGLLLHALRQRAKANRIAELEMIIASLQNQR